MISRKFLLAGKSIFTFANPQKESYTFKIQYSDKMDNYFVYLLTGPDNENSYTYMGMLNMTYNLEVIITRKSKYTYDSLPVKVFNYAVKIVNGDKPLLDDYFLEHEGKCGKCGRTLTTQKSIEIGLGPKCRGEL